MPVKDTDTSATGDGATCTNNHQTINDNDNDNEKVVEDTTTLLWRTLVVGFGANMILFVGYVCNLAFSVFELQNRDRESRAIVLYFFAFALLLLSGIVELGLDLFSTRVIGHGRYCDTSHKANQIISVLFLASAAMDIVAFYFWLERDFDTEDKLLFASGYTILFMATIVIYFQFVELFFFQDNNNAIITTVTGRTDFCANSLVLVATILNVAKLHMESELEHLEDLNDRLEFSLAPLWLLSSVFFVITDLRMLKETAS